MKKKSTVKRGSGREPAHSFYRSKARERLYFALLSFRWACLLLSDYSIQHFMAASLLYGLKEEPLLFLCTRIILPANEKAMKIP